MLRHIVMIRWKPEATEDQKQAVQDAINGMRSQVPEIVDLRWGADIGRGPNNFDLAVVMDFGDREAFKRYLSSAVHQSYVQGAAKAAVGSLASVQHLW